MIPTSHILNGIGGTVVTGLAIYGACVGWPPLIIALFGSGAYLALYPSRPPLL